MSGMLRADACARKQKAETGRFQAGTYAFAAKAISTLGGLEVLTRYMANAVSPGAIRTELGGGLNDEFEALLAAQTALGKVGEPQDVARVIALLLSQEGSWINAQTIEVGGGYNI